MQAGLTDAFQRSSAGDLFIVMDSDLQHPPDLLPSIVTALREGCDHVQMLRREPASLPWTKKAASASFYWVLRHLAGLSLSAGSSDFRGMNRAFLKAYLRLCEVGRFNRGLFHWVGFERRDIVYQAASRAAGGSKYTLRRMAALAITGLTQFSSRPLILLCSAIVLASFLLCSAYVAWEVYRYAHGHRYVLGWPTLIFFITFWSGSIALIQLVTAVYLARVFDEVKRRPAFIVRRSGGDGGE
ncbi:MAG: glycosyltransferase [Acidobacteria bacterium]|nr:glycosyltransferase [Acidobacteriota bacterium]